MWRMVRAWEENGVPVILYYSKAKAGWVTEGWTTYGYTEWRNKFGKRGTFLSPRTFLDDDGRMWEWYATVIPVFDEDEKL